MAARLSERPAATRPNEQSSMDFVSDALFDGRRIRALTLVDNHTREALAIVVDSGIRGEHVAEAVEAVAASRGAPASFAWMTSYIAKPRADLGRRSPSPVRTGVGRRINTNQVASTVMGVPAIIANTGSDVGQWLRAAAALTVLETR